MDPNRTPYPLGSEDGETLWFFGMLVTMKATTEQTGGEFILIEELAPRGTATPLHVQPTDDESFYILEGEMTFYLEDGQPIPASAGSFVHIPKGFVPHAFQVDSETARFLVFTRPPHERFIRAAAEPAPSTNPSAARTARYGEGWGRSGGVRGRDTRPSAEHPAPLLTHKHQPGHIRVSENRIWRKFISLL